jgi:hypothetical protein
VNEHILRRPIPQWDQKSAARDAQPWECRGQALHAGQMRCGGGDLEGSPLNDSFRRKHGDLLPCPDCEPRTPPQQIAKI